MAANTVAHREDDLEVIVQHLPVDLPLPLLANY
jgi:hypothetical protein